MFKPGDKVALKEGHLWAPKGAVGEIITVLTEWDPSDRICWDVNVFFAEDVLAANNLSGDWSGKIAGLYFSDIKLAGT